MSYLLDTHIVLWLASSPDKLSDTVKSILQGSDSKVISEQMEQLKAL